MISSIRLKQGGMGDFFVLFVEPTECFVCSAGKMELM